MLVSFLFVFSLFCSRVVAGQNASILVGDLGPDGKPFTAIHFASHGDYGCQDRDDIINGLQNLDEAINLAGVLATSAANALLIPGVERSPAFLRWFGAGNADKVEAIRVNNYLAVNNWLNFPTTHIDFYAQKIRPNGPFTNYDILPTDLIYVCGLRDRKPCETDENGRDMLAITFSPMPTDEDDFGATILFLCPFSFEVATFEQMQNAWTGNPQIDLPHLSSTLLHEAQHMVQLTGPAHEADDIPTTPPADDCYSIKGCQAFSDDDKIKNAQNYVFFALDAQFKSQDVHPPVPRSDGLDAQFRPHDVLSPSSGSRALDLAAASVLPGNNTSSKSEPVPKSISGSKSSKLQSLLKSFSESISSSQSISSLVSRPNSSTREVTPIPTLTKSTTRPTISSPSKSSSVSLLLSTISYSSSSSRSSPSSLAISLSPTSPLSTPFSSTSSLSIKSSSSSMSSSSTSLSSIKSSSSSILSFSTSLSSKKPSSSLISSSSTYSLSLTSLSSLKSSSSSASSLSSSSATSSSATSSSATSSSATSSSSMSKSTSSSLTSKSTSSSSTSNSTSSSPTSKSTSSSSTSNSTSSTSTSKSISSSSISSISVTSTTSSSRSTSTSSSSPSSSSSSSSSTHAITVAPVPITDTVSKGSTDYVGIGVVVIGGAGGGFYVAGGKTYAIDQGQTQTAGAKGNPPPIQTHPDPSSNNPTTSSSSSRSTSSCSGSSSSACFTAPAKNYFYDIDLDGLNDQQITSLMGPTDYISPTTLSSTTSSSTTSSSTTSSSTTSSSTTSSSSSTPTPTPCPQALQNPGFESATSANPPPPDWQNTLGAGWYSGIEMGDTAGLCHSGSNCYYVALQTVGGSDSFVFNLSQTTTICENQPYDLLVWVKWISDSAPTSSCDIYLCLGQACQNYPVQLGDQADRYFIQLVMEGVFLGSGTTQVTVSVSANGGSEGNCQGYFIYFDDFMLLNSNSDNNIP